MKKVLSFCLAAFTIFAASAQNYQPAPLIKERAKTVINENATHSNGPVKVIALTDAKGIQRIPFGSSFNMLTLLGTENNNCFYNADLDYLMFTHRDGGSYGGNSIGGGLRCNYTKYFGTDLDSVDFVYQSNFRYRYPCGVIFNPAGNTDPANAMAIVTGPITNGTYWNNSFFCSQKLDGSSLKTYFEPTYDTFRPPYINLTACQDSTIKVAGRYAQYQNTSLKDGICYFKGGKVQADSVAWNTNIYKFVSTYQQRHFSNDTTSWAFAPYMAFSNDGMIGYFYVMGLESTDDMLANGPRPVVWKTIDGGANWARIATPDLSTMTAKMTKVIKPVRSTLGLDSASFIYRPGIMSGATVEETNFPGIVDMDGNLHIACNIEGMYSNNVDSLLYTYAYNIWNVFDLHTTTTGWDVTLVDTINAGIDKGIILSDQYLDHSFHVAKSADESKIFFMWTDTELDTANYMPDIYAKGFDLNTDIWTPTKKMTIESDYYLFNAAQQVADSMGSYFLPATFASVNGSDIDAEPIHHFIKGLKFDPSDFSGIDENKTSVSIDDVLISPNPAVDFVNVDFTINKPANVKISVYNLLGKELMSKNYGKQVAGKSRVTLNTNNFASGIYFFTVQTGNERVTKKVIVD